MVDFIDSPQPYIIGIELNLWKEIGKQVLQRDEINIFDYENGKFIKTETLHEIPQRLRHDLALQIDSSLTSYKNCNTNSVSKLPFSDKETKKQECLMLVTLQLKKAIFNFMLALFKDYTECYHKTQDTPNESSPPYNASSIFNFEKYLNIFTDSDHHKFMKEIVNTQSFATLIEKSIEQAEAYNEKSDLTIFIGYLRIKSNDLLIEEEDKMIHRAINSYQKPISYKIEDIYTLYEKCLTTNKGFCRKEIDKSIQLPLLVHRNIVKMPKINYQKARTVNKSIMLFRRPGNGRLQHELMSGGEKFNSLSEINCLIPFQTRQLDLSKMSSFKHEKKTVNSQMAFNKENTHGNIPDEDDDDIASEFNNNEMSIADSLVARNICKCKLVSPASKPFTICNSIDASRLRSLTTVYDDVYRKNIDDETPTHLPNHMAINVPNEPTSTVLILRKKQLLKQ